MLRRFAVLNLLLMTLFICSSLASQTPFDRLRIVITTSSDWTILRFEGNERIVNAIGVPLQGSPHYGWSYDSLSVNQPLADATMGQSVRVQFDIILKSGTAGSIAFESTKGNIGTIQMDFYQFNTTTPKLVASVVNANTEGHPNPKAFTVDAALLEGEVVFDLSRPPVPPLILAFYYPWYYLDSWESPVLNDLPTVLYSSDDVMTISHHVHLAKQAGIDGFISSWWGPGDYTDGNLQKLLAVSEDLGFRVSIYFETLTGEPSRARSEYEILSWMRYFFQTYGDNEYLIRVEGKPVIFIWAAGAAPLDMWRRVFDKLESEGFDGVYIANTLDPAYLEVFHGLHDYGSAFRDNIEADFQQASMAAKTYGWLENDPQLRIWAATAQPGYNDVAIPGREGAIIERNNGATYEHTFQASINSDPDWILITSFNEWWEHTHIEPSIKHGDLYLELTAKYADMYKGFEPRAPVNFYIPPISSPDGTVHLTWDSPMAQTPDSYNVYRGTSALDLAPLAAGIAGLTYDDISPADGEYYYAVTALFGNAESPPSEVFSTISSRDKSKASHLKEIPVDIAMYTESTSWISETEADRQASLIVQMVREKVNSIDIVGEDALPAWLLSHTRNNQPDIIITFGDFPDSIYPSGNQKSDRSLAEIFLDDGNIFLNTGDYIFWGKGRNGEGGLRNMMDISTTMWGDNTAVRVTEAGAAFTPSLRNFVTDRPFHLSDLQDTDWEAEISFADDGGYLADPVIVRNRKTGGRIGIVYQKSDGNLPRAQVISEIILNWLSTTLPLPPWDTNADRQVDINDIIVVGLHYGETIIQPIFPNPDVNGDGLVNINDLVLVGRHFGEVYRLDQVSD